MSNVRKILAEAFGLSPGASEDEIAQAWADDIIRQQDARSMLAGSDDPQGKFHELADRTSKVLGISLSDAYSLVSKEAPTLYDRAKKRAELN